MRCAATETPHRTADLWVKGLMRYAGVHRDVDFVVFHSGGAWNYVVGGETRGPYGHRDHAIQAAIKRIDEILFDASKVRRG